MSQARDFHEHIKKNPHKKNDPKTWREYKVINVLYSWNNQGFYKVTSFDFEDISFIENNKVYD